MIAEDLKTRGKVCASVSGGVSVVMNLGDPVRREYPEPFPRARSTLGR
jgi:hypothetical protein